MNKQFLIGRIGKDVEMTRNASGLSISKTTIATSERYKDKDGNLQEETEWHNLTFFGKLAEIAEKYVKKGDQISIVGKTKHSSWEKDGQKFYRTEVTVAEMEFLSKKSGESQVSQNAAPQLPRDTSVIDLSEEGQDDGLPF